MSRPSLFKSLAIGGTTAWLALFALAPFLLIVGVSVLARDPASFVAPALSLEGYRSIADEGFLLIIIPFWTNSLIRTYALIFIIKSQGLLNTALLGLGLIGAPLEILYTDTAVLVGLIYTLLPFMILPLYSSIEKLDPCHLEAAKDLGAGLLRAFWEVTLPLTWPGILAGTMLTFLPALGMFYVPDVLGGAKSLLIGNFIKNQFLTARDWPTGSAASVVLTLIMALPLAFYSGSTKGTTPRQAEDLGA